MLTLSDLWRARIHTARRGESIPWRGRGFVIACGRTSPGGVTGLTVLRRTTERCIAEQINALFQVGVQSLYTCRPAAEQCEWDRTSNLAQPVTFAVFRALACSLRYNPMASLDALRLRANGRLDAAWRALDRNHSQSIQREEA